MTQRLGLLLMGDSPALHDCKSQRQQLLKGGLAGLISSRTAIPATDPSALKQTKRVFGSCAAQVLACCICC